MAVQYRAGRINVADYGNLEDLINDIVPFHLEKSFLVCDLNEIIMKFQVWKKITSRVKLYYSVRCNNSDAVLQILSTLNVGFVCVSKSEIQQVLSMGVDPSQIVFGHTRKFTSHIQFAIDNFVNFMNFDTKEELYKIQKISPNAKTIIHIKNDIKPKDSFELKVGCDPHTEAEDLLKLALSLNVNVIGVCFAIDLKSDFRSICNSLNAARNLFTLAKSAGHSLNLLYINGELVVNPGGNDTNCKFSSELNLAINEYFPDENIQIIFEDGSYLVRSVFKLASRIVGMKIRDEKCHYYINDGVFQNFNSVIYWNTNTFPQSLRGSNGTLLPSVVWGPTCDSVDILHDNILLPKMNCGDWILFNNMGSYTFVLTTNFNSFGSSSIYYFISKQNWRNLKIHTQLLDPN